MNSAQRLYDFWSSFSLPAFDETLVQTGEPIPRITYETSEGEFGTEIALTASLWYRSASWEEITQKAMEIESRIGRGGIILRTDKGALWIKKGTPFAQRMADSSDDGIRRIVLNISAEFIE